MAWEKPVRTDEEIALDLLEEGRIYDDLKEREMHFYNMKVKVYEPKITKGGKRLVSICLAYSKDRVWTNIYFALWEEEIDLHYPFLMQYCDGKYCTVGIPEGAIVVEGRNINVRNVVFLFGLTASITLLDANPYNIPVTKDAPLTDEELDEIANAPY